MPEPAPLRLAMLGLIPGNGHPYSWSAIINGYDRAAMAREVVGHALDPETTVGPLISARQRDRVVEKLLGELKILKGRTVALMGLAFKPDTDDLRDAPAVDIAKRLIERGARVRAHDPVAMDRFRKEHPDLDIALFESPADAAYDCDAIVITTEWPDFRELEWDRVAKAMHTPVLLDGRNLLDRARMTKAGFRYLTLAG